jgi:molecular chaperone IbpA
MNLISSLTPSLFRQMVVGFDDFFDSIDYNYRETYPPYNIRRKADDRYILEIAVAGFRRKDLEVSLDNNTLVVEGMRDTTENEYIHKGVSTRNFKRTWSLARYMEVDKADFEDGILKLELKRNLPEELKPKKIKIN